MAVICIIIFFFTFGGGAILFTVPLVAEILVHDFMLVGALMSFPAFISMLSSIPVGVISDSIGRKNVLLMGLFAMILFSIILPYSSSLIPFLLAMLLMGFGNAVVNTASRAFIMDIAPPEKTARYFGLFNTAASLGWTLGAIMGGFVLSWGFFDGVSYISYFFIASCVVAASLTVLLKDTVKAAGRMTDAFSILSLKKYYAKGIREYLKIKRVGGVVLVLTFLFTFFDRLLWTFEPLYSTMGLESSIVGVILAMFIGPYLLFEALAGYLADRFGKFRTLIPGLFLAGVSLIIFASTNNPLILIVSAFLSTAGLAFSWPSISGLISDASPKGERGCIVGVWNSAEGFGFMLGPIIGGLIANYYSAINMPFMFMGVIFLISCGFVAIHKPSS